MFDTKVQKDSTKKNDSCHLLKCKSLSQKTWILALYIEKIVTRLGLLFLYMVKKVVNRMRGKTFSWHFHVNVLAQLLLFFSIQHQCLVFLFKVDTQLAVLRENFNQNKIKIILKSQASLLLGKLLNIPRTFFYYGPPKSGFAIAYSDKHIRCQRDLTWC